MCPETGYIGYMAESNGKLAFNGARVWKNIRTEGLCLGAAELVSVGVSLGVVGVADTIAPNLIKSCSKSIGKIIEPHLDNIEKFLSTVCKLEECQPDPNKSRQERAETIGKTCVVFGAAWALSLAAKLATRKRMNEAFGLSVKAPRTGLWYKDFFNDYLKPSAHDTNVLKWDEGVHYGSLLLLNTVGAKYTDDMLHSTSKVLQKCGMSKTKADELAAMGIIWELPNILGFVAGVGAITKHHITSANGNGIHAASHAERVLAHTSDISSVLQKS